MRRTVLNFAILLALAGFAAQYAPKMPVAIGLALVVFGYGALCLYRLGRLHERHHLYWGAGSVLLGLLLVALGVPTLGWWAVGVGIAVMLDDAFQHGVQEADRADGRPARPDFTPIHWLGVWIERRVGWT